MYNISNSYALLKLTDHVMMIKYLDLPVIKKKNEEWPNYCSLPVTTYSFIILLNIMTRVLQNEHFSVCNFLPS